MSPALALTAIRPTGCQPPTVYRITILPTAASQIPVLVRSADLVSHPRMRLVEAEVLGHERRGYLLSFDRGNPTYESCHHTSLQPAVDMSIEAPIRTCMKDQSLAVYVKLGHGANGLHSHARASLLAYGDISMQYQAVELPPP
ncbi:hypothetical protein LY76DRAFT_345968 [Colletotrichum caudatum]|nr:hypothetical protein LY76DRAFT_345968 [Colletotrichum caudatum]